jgi:DNA repair exonuclease SbcCD ATPase subunit
MKLTSLEIDNFLSVKNARTELNDKGLVLIRGNNEDEDTFDSNGAGKSTTYSEAPTWCLFGETIRGHKGDKVCNRDVKNNTRVAVGLEDDNGDKYEIIRHRKHKFIKITFCSIEMVSTSQVRVTLTPITQSLTCYKWTF